MKMKLRIESKIKICNYKQYLRKHKNEIDKDKNNKIYDLDFVLSIHCKLTAVARPTTV